MNIIKPYARLFRIHGNPPNEAAGVEALRFIEWCGRISHRSEESQTMDSWKRFIPAVVMGHGDWSIVEHANATVDMLVDRGITHEIVRHRLCSFTQKSTWFVNYEKKMPPGFVEPAGLEEDDALHQTWCSAIDAAEAAYRNMLALGAAPQIARSVFPNALASRIIVTANLRNWRHVLIMRTTKEAHPQMREVMIPLLAEFKSVVPLLFDDIEPMAKQAKGMKRVR